ncbi:hypothetical protein [Pseudoxanthomonas sp. USHLN014]|uniref:hypothetical protein n=1 Tax=Pseudoxanthomonas sp. USHLN014 TaxID=3081297 RepID=UPI00301C3459
MTDNPDNEHQNTRMERVAENTVTRFWMQLITPVLIGLVAWFGQRQLNSIESKQSEINVSQEQQGQRIGAMASDIRDLNTRFDLAAIKRIDELDARVKRLEQAAKTP